MMRSGRWFPAALVLLLVLVSLVPSPSEACAPPRCPGGWFFPAQGTVPANLDLVFWGPIRDWSFDPTLVGSEDVQLVLDTQCITEPVPLTMSYDEDYVHFELELLEPLLADATYLLWGANFCDPETGLPTQAAFQTSGSAEHPTALGSVTAEHTGFQSVTVSTVSGSCSVPVTADTVRVSLELDLSAQPWEDALLYTTLVDEEPWHPSHFLPVPVPFGESWEGRGQDLLYAICQSDDPGAQPGLSEGTHTVRFQASIPGVEGTLQTEEIQVSLSCTPPEEDPDQPIEPTPDAGSDLPLEPEGDAGPDDPLDPQEDGNEDQPPVDSGEASDQPQEGTDLEIAQQDVIPGDAPPDGAGSTDAGASSEEGCACQTAAEPGAMPVLLLLGMMLGWLWYRRSRQGLPSSRRTL
ncbi:MAG: hypothetical protein JW797_19980 [Bradymonadales bacterium]|nr:hypothetical protein [Bradymonadales bacterium]